MDNTYFATYQGVVAAITDPLQQNRVRLKVPQIMGEAVTDWAYPYGPVSQPPQVNDLVAVSFVGGDLTKPVYSEMRNQPLSTQYDALGSAAAAEASAKAWATSEANEAANAAYASAQTYANGKYNDAVAYTQGQFAYHKNSDPNPHPQYLLAPPSGGVFSATQKTILVGDSIQGDGQWHFVSSTYFNTFTAVAGTGWIRITVSGNIGAPSSSAGTMIGFSAYVSALDNTLNTYHHRGITAKSPAAGVGGLMYGSKVTYAQVSPGASFTVRPVAFISVAENTGFIQLGQITVEAVQS